MTQAMQGVRVLDLTRVLAGPLAAQVLADLGADVIKVERPKVGDDSRGWGPPFQRDRDGKELADSLYFLCCNRGKRSVTVDLAKAEGQALIRRLASQCDVLMENYKVGDLERYGLSYASLSQANPRLIYCSITGFGQDGPYAKRPGYDPVVQAMGGLMSVTGERESPPQRVGVAVTDATTALYAVIAIQAALRHRDLTGEGQCIDMALLDVQMASMINVAQTYLSAGLVGERNGNPHPSVMPSQSYPCIDGLVMLAAGNDGQFRKLCDALGASALAIDARFLTNGGRFAHRDELNALLEAITRRHTTAQLTEKLSSFGVPCGPVQTIDQAFDDPQVQHRGIKVTLPDQRLGEVPVVASPLRLSRSPVRYERAPPALGADTDEVLTAVAGLRGDEIAALRAAGAI